MSGQIGTRSKRHRLRNSAIPFNWVIFGSLLLLAFLLRVVAIITLVAYQDCDAIIYLTNGVYEGLGYTAAIAFCAALMGVFQLLVARAGWIEGTWRWSDVALGVVNLAAVSVILVHGLLYFGFSNPETRAGFTINRLSSHLDNSQFFPPEPMEFDVPDPAYGWEPDPDGGWRNERAELTIRDVPLRKCWTDDLRGLITPLAIQVSLTRRNTIWISIYPCFTISTEMSCHTQTPQDVSNASAPNTQAGKPRPTARRS